MPTAQLIRTNGSSEEISLPDQNDEIGLLYALQRAVGGMIQVVFLTGDRLMIINEMGKLLNFEKNLEATAIAYASVSIPSYDYIAGDALIIPKSMIR